MCYKKQDHILAINTLEIQPQIYIKNNNGHAKTLIDTGATVSVIDQKSLPDNCTLNKFPGKNFISYIFTEYYRIH